MEENYFFDVQIVLALTPSSHLMAEGLFNMNATMAQF